MRNKDYLITPYFQCSHCGCKADHLEYVETETFDYIKKATFNDSVTDLVLDNNYTRKLNKDKEENYYRCIGCGNQVFIDGTLLHLHISKWMYEEYHALLDKFKIPDFPYNVEHFIAPIACACCEEKVHVVFYYENNVYCSMCIQTEFEEMKMEHVL